MNKNTWGLLVLPIASIILGLYLIFNPFGFTVTLCRIIGLMILLAGLGAVISAVTGYKNTPFYGPLLLVGIAALVGGLFLFSRPWALIGVVNLAISVFLLAEGAVNIQNAFTRKGCGDTAWWLPLVIGIVCLMLGLSTMFTPLGTNTLTQIAGIILAVGGVSNLLTALRS